MELRWLMKVIVMDIDNTICEKKGKKEYAELEPLHEVVDQMTFYRKKGYKIILYTARQMRTYGGNIGLVTANMVPVLTDWLDKWGIPYDELHVGKPWCDEGFYVDDRAIRPSEFLDWTEKEILERIEDDQWKQS